MIGRKREAIETAPSLTMSKLYGFHNPTVVTIVGSGGYFFPDNAYSMFVLNL